ncbi:hypothetical protein [Pseudaquabacterium terrae]|nr:hypothetical protein [Aquabacterium terrae]
MTRTRRWLLHGAAVAVLAIVFAAYFNPHLLVELAGRAWACF